MGDRSVGFFGPRNRPLGLGALAHGATHTLRRERATTARRAVDGADHVRAGWWRGCDDYRLRMGTRFVRSRFFRDLLAAVDALANARPPALMADARRPKCHAAPRLYVEMMFSRRVASRPRQRLPTCAVTD